MGRRKRGHKCLRKIVIQNQDGDPALIYNLDKKGRLIYEHPVCVAIPAHIKYETPGTYEYTPPPVKVYNKSKKKEDPSIIGTNTITITIPSPIISQECTIADQENINDDIRSELFGSTQTNSQNKDIIPIDIINQITCDQPQQQSQRNSSTLFGSMDHSVISSIKSYENVFSINDNKPNAPLPIEQSLQTKVGDLHSDINFTEMEHFF